MDLQRGMKYVSQLVLMKTQVTPLALPHKHVHEHIARNIIIFNFGH